MQLRVIGPVAGLLVGQAPIPDDRRRALAVRCSPALRIGGRHLAALECVQVFVGEPGGLADAVDGHESKAAVERSVGRTRLVENIRIGPVAHALEQSAAALELLEYIGAADIAVVHWITRVVARAPFGEVERQIGEF